MNKKILGAVIVAAAVLLGGTYALKSSKTDVITDNKEAIEITHELGTTKIDGIPERVVVLDYGALDCLESLDVNIVGVPQSGKLPSYLEKYTSDEYGNTGSVKEPDLEAIHALEPDLIVMSGRMSDYYEKLEEIAPTLYVAVDSENYISSTSELITMYGDIFNAQDKAKELVSDINDKVEEVKEKVQHLDTNASILMVNGRAMSAFGSKSRYSIIYNELGFEEADQSVSDSTHGQEVSSEYLVELNPSYIFVVNRNAVTGKDDISVESIVENELVKKTDAYINRKIVYLDPITWYTVSGGYKSTLSMIEEINQVL